MAANVQSLYAKNMILVTGGDVAWADNVDQPIGFYIGNTAGNLVFTPQGGAQITLPVAANSWIMCAAKAFSNSSTATQVWAIWG